MSQVNITLNTNTVDVNTTNNQIVVTDPTNPTNVNVVQPVTTVVEVITAGPQGIPGILTNTGNLLTTASFNAYTGSSSSQFAGTSSFAISSSRAINSLTASYVLPLTQSVLVSGSLGITGPTSISTDFGYGTSSVALTVYNNTLGDEGGSELIGTGIEAQGAIGVLGRSDEGVGVKGIATGTQTTGVMGEATQGTGVVANGNIGVRATGGNLAIQAIGDVSIVGDQVLSGSLTISGSANITGNVTAPSFTGSLFGTSSWAISASNTVLQTGITSNATVGGATAPRTFNAGTSLETIIRTMLVTYIAPTIGNFTLLNGGSSVLSSNTVVEVSSSYTFNTASFTAVADDPNGRYAYSASFTASGASTGNFNYFFGNNVLGSSNNLGLGGSQIVNNSTNGTVTFTLRGINPETNAIISQSRTATYVYPYYYGMSAIDYSTTGNVSASLTQLTQAQGTKTVSITGSSAYVYFCYPAAYADLTSIKDGNGFEVLSSFTKYTRTQDGAPGKWAGISYDIYRSNTLTNVSPAQNYIFT